MAQRKIFTAKDGKKYVWDGNDFQEVSGKKAGLGDYMEANVLGPMAELGAGNPVTRAIASQLPGYNPETSTGDTMSQLKSRQQELALLNPSLAGGTRLAGELPLAAPAFRGIGAGNIMRNAVMEGALQGARYGPLEDRALMAATGVVGGAAPAVVGTIARGGWNAARGASASVRMPAKVQSMLQDAKLGAQARAAEFGVGGPKLGRGERANTSTLTADQLQTQLGDVAVPPAIRAMLDQRAVGADDALINQMKYQFDATAGQAGYNEFQNAMEGALGKEVKKAIGMKQSQGLGRESLGRHRDSIGKKIGEIERSVEWEGLRPPKDVVVTPNEQAVWKAAMDQVGGSTRGGIPDAKRVMDKLRTLTDKERPGTEVHDALLKLMDSVQDQIEDKLAGTGRLKEWKNLRKQYAITMGMFDRGVERGGGFNLTSLANNIEKRYRNFKFDRDQSDLEKIIRTMQAVNRTGIKGSNTADKIASGIAKAGLVAGGLGAMS